MSSLDQPAMMIMILIIMIMNVIIIIMKMMMIMMPMMIMRSLHEHAIMDGGEMSKL